MLFTVIPVKHFTKGKSRLKPLLNDRDRHNLNQKMFSHVLQVAINTLVPNRTIIVSSDQIALNLATESGAITIREQNGQGLNAALELGRSAAMSKGATAILLLPADLPTLMKEDVEEIIELAKISKPLTIIAPDRWDQGTNALLISPPNEIELLFGENSNRAHQNAARARNIDPVICRRDGFAFDVDTPDDYLRLNRQYGAVQTPN